jgi:alpha-tubulin suppressor-like RCC1 family protein
LLSSGTIQCWGFNAEGELGNGTTKDPSVPITVSGITDARAIAAGDSHTCALLSGGSVQCWGDNAYGQLGNGSTNTCLDGGSRPCSLTPIAVSGITNAIAIAAGEEHTCALLSGGSVQCWGSYYSAPFNGSVSFFSLMPVTVNGF